MSEIKAQKLLGKIPAYRNRPMKLMAIGEGITNHNFRVDLDDESIVVRLFGDDTHYLGIDREREHTCASLAADMGIGPEVLHYLPAEGGSVTRFIEAAPLSPDLASRPDNLERIVDAIKLYHNGPAFPGYFSAFQTVRDYHRLAVDRAVHFPASLPEVFRKMEQIESALQSDQSNVPCHNDLLAGNFLEDGEKIWIIDWEYAAMGDPFFDLGNFSVNQELDQAQNDQLLAYYFGEVRTGDQARLSLMRLVSDLRESFWGYLQSGISSLDFDYLDYGRTHLERFLFTAKSDRFEDWLRAV